MTPDERAEAVLTKGGSEEQAACQCSIPTYVNPLMAGPAGTAADPIAILLTQSSGVPISPIRVPISHLVSDQGRNPISGLVWRPNPPQQNTLPTISSPSYANWAGQCP